MTSPYTQMVMRVTAFGFAEDPDYLIETIRGASRSTIEAWECPRCAAVTADPVVHIKWHEKLGA